MALPKTYDWKRVRMALKLLSEKFPDFFPLWVLIGGGACWFYREALNEANDKDFSVPAYTPEEEQTWLSKDIDFMGMSEEEAADLLNSPFKPETHTITFEGLEVDFLEEGLRLTLDNVLRNNREVRTGDFVFRVVAPETLYNEKCSLIAVKERPQDRLHHAILAKFLKYEFCSDLEAAGTLDPGDWVGRAREVKTADLNFFINDNHFNKRLANAVAALDPAKYKRAKHHLPGFAE